MNVLHTNKIYIPRRSRRVVVQWPARYMMSTDECWVECGVIDFSLDGAALDIPVPADEPSGALTIELHDAGGHPVGLRIRARVANWEVKEDGRLRLGVEFVGVTTFERYQLAGVMSRERQASKTARGG